MAADEVFRDELSHNLRTPLSAVRACSQLLLEGKGPDKLSPGPANLVSMIDAAGHELQSQLMKALEKTLRASSTKVRALASVCSGMARHLTGGSILCPAKHSCDEAPDATYSDFTTPQQAALARDCSFRPGWTVVG